MKYVLVAWSAVALVTLARAGQAAGSAASAAPAPAVPAPGPGPASSTLPAQALVEARQYVSPEATLLSSLPFPRHLAATVALVGKWLWVNSSLLVLGAVSVLGLCALTPFCAVSFTKFETLPDLPEGFYRSLPSLPSLPGPSASLLKQAQNILDGAVDKYNSMQP